MADAPSRKRTSERQLTKEGEDDNLSEDAPTAPGDFQRASDTVISGRRIVKAKRPGGGSTVIQAAANPFKGIRLGQPSAPSTAAREPDSILPTRSEQPAQANVIIEKEPAGEEVTSAQPKEITIAKELEIGTEGAAVSCTDDKEKAVVAEVNAEKVAIRAEDDGLSRDGDSKEVASHQENEGDEGSCKDGPPAPSFAQLSSGANAFAGSFGHGFAFSTSGLFGKSEAGVVSSASSTFSTAPTCNSTAPFPSLSSIFGSSTGAKPAALLGSSASSTAITAPLSTEPSVAVTSIAFENSPPKTGEEKEKAVFAAEAVLFEFGDGGKWRERGKGEVRLNVPEEAVRHPRLVMRARGNYRLLLNANLYPDMKLAQMDGRGVTFACVNTAGVENPSLATFAVRLKDVETAAKFLAEVERHKQIPLASIETATPAPEEETGATD